MSSHMVAGPLRCISESHEQIFQQRRQKLCGLLWPYLWSQSRFCVLCWPSSHNATPIQRHGTQTSQRTCSHFLKPPQPILQWEENYHRLVKSLPTIIQLGGESFTWLLHKHSSLGTLYQVATPLCSPRTHPTCTSSLSLEHQSPLTRTPDTGTLSCSLPRSHSLRQCQACNSSRTWSTETKLCLCAQYQIFKETLKSSESQTFKIKLHSTISLQDGN